MLTDHRQQTPVKKKIKSKSAVQKKAKSTLVNLCREERCASPSRSPALGALTTRVVCALQEACTQVMESKWGVQMLPLTPNGCVTVSDEFPWTFLRVRRSVRPLGRKPRLRTRRARRVPTAVWCLVPAALQDSGHAN